jgi:hypothetical protein
MRYYIGRKRLWDACTNLRGAFTRGAFTRGAFTDLLRHAVKVHFVEHIQALCVPLL